MSEPDEFPAFSGSGDPREEALWQAYQAMLRRRRDPGPRWAPSASSADQPPDPAPPVVAERPPAPRQAHAETARRIAPRPLAAQAAEPGPLVFQPVETLDTSVGAPPRRAAAGQHRRGDDAGRRTSLWVGIVLAAGAALAVAIGVALRPHGAPPSLPASKTHGPAVTIAGTPTEAAVPTQRSVLPCFVDGRLVGRYALADCTSRGGVASGSLQGDAGAGLAHAVPPTSAPDQAAPPRPPRMVAEPPIGAAPSAGPPVYRDDTPQAAAPADGHGATPASEGSPQRAATLAVRKFYEALEHGDGGQAAAVVVPEKRAAGPLSAQELTRFYASLQAPLRITKIDPIDDDTVFVRYQFVSADNHLCLGVATVATTQRDGNTLVKAIRTLNGC